MQIAVIGNGPSAEQHLGRWSGAEMVVRCNAFNFGPCDVWASHFDDDVIAKAEEVSAITLEASALWLCMSPTPARLIRPGCDLAANAARAAGARPVTQMTDRQWLELVCCAAAERRPTTGICAVRMALEHRPDELVIAGFDATEPDKDGWGNKFFEWLGVETYHNFAAEKRALGLLAEKGLFCGQKWSTKVTWHRLEN